MAEVEVRVSYYESGPQPYGQHGVQHYPEQSQATTVLVLGILGILVCGVLAPIAWVMGNKEVAAIDAGRRPPDQRQTANIGRILGIIGTALIILGIVATIFFVIIAIAAGTASGT